MDACVKKATLTSRCDEDACQGMAVMISGGACVSAASCRWQSHFSCSTMAFYSCIAASKIVQGLCGRGLPSGCHRSQYVVSGFPRQRNYVSRRHDSQEVCAS